MLGLLLQDKTRMLANGAIANLVGGALVFVENLPMNVLVDMSICCLSTIVVNVSGCFIFEIKHLFTSGMLVFVAYTEIYECLKWWTRSINRS